MKATGPYDPFKNYPEFALSDLPADTPPEYRARLRTLLPHVALHPAVADLVYATRDAAGVPTGPPVPVQNRPWEWTEYLGDAPTGELPARGSGSGAGAGPSDAHSDRPQVRNSAALSLELFDARVTGDRVIPPASVRTGPGGAGADMLGEATLRSFQDDVYAESAFKRDWRETRIPPDEDDDEDDPHGGGGDTSGDAVESLVGAGSGAYASDYGVHHRSASTSSRRPSPASSVRSAGSVRPSPAHPPSRLSVSTAGDVIDVDAFDGVSGTGTGTGTGSSQKRKAMSTIAEEDDDEIEFVEGPVPAASGQKRAKAGKTAAAGKTTKRRR